MAPRALYWLLASAVAAASFAALAAEFAARPAEIAAGVPADLAAGVPADVAGGLPAEVIQLDSEVFWLDADGAAVAATQHADEALRSGQRLRFVTRYAHAGGQPAEAVVIDAPVPEYGRYVDASARGADGVEFSCDGIEFGVADASACPDLRAIRFRLDVDPVAGSSGEVVFDVDVR